MNAATDAVVEPAEMPPDATTRAPSRLSRRRMLMLGGPVALVLAAAGWWLTGGGAESTDNAYLHFARLSVAPSMSGRVTRVAVADNQHVRAGELLFEVDPIPYRLALAEADAAVAAARLSIAQLKTAYQQAAAQARLAADEAAYRTSERERLEKLSASGAVSTTDLQDARYAEQKAIDQRDLADSAVAGALVALGGNIDIAVDSHPKVQSALVARSQALYNMKNATVTAPADGIIYQASSFREGQMVGAGAPVFSLVKASDVWIEANFKETQLGDIAVGQAAEVTFDSRPGQTFEAVVEAIGAGTGSEFSILPAQNATGNWVKVTQRVPVRLRLTDPAAAEGLASGQSAEVTVITGKGHSLADLLPWG